MSNKIYYGHLNRRVVRRYYRYFCRHYLPLLTLLLTFILYIIAGTMEYNGIGTISHHQRILKISRPQYICCTTLAPNSDVNLPQIDLPKVHSI